MSWNYFSLDEFACPCCKRNKISHFLIEQLDEAREYAGVPFVINSGYRCPSHNIAVGGSKTSSHLKGEAVDIAVPNSSYRFLMMEGLTKAGFVRIGIGNSFIHVDVDMEKDQDVIWVYN